MNEVDCGLVFGEIVFPKRMVPIFGFFEVFVYFPHEHLIDDGLFDLGHERSGVEVIGDFAIVGHEVLVDLGGDVEPAPGGGVGGEFFLGCFFVFLGVGKCGERGEREDDGEEDFHRGSMAVMAFRAIRLKK